MDEEILFSVVIPVKNGDHWLDKLFQKLMQQTLFSRTEIIVIDSGSTDRSLEIIHQYPIRLFQIPPGEFNHGETRNRAVREARGKYIVMTVQDAVPASDLWLQYFLDGFENEKVAGVCGQQVVPHDLNKNPVLWFRPVSPPSKTFYYFNNPADLLKLDPATQKQKCSWDNVTSAYRRDILIEFPFAKIDFAEDILWAKEILLQGFTLVHNSNAAVFHYHHHLAEFVLPRYFSIYYFEYKLFKLKPTPAQHALRYILTAIKTLLRESSVSWPAKFKWLLFNVRYRIALQKTIGIFNKALKRGEEFLDIQYRQICEKPPQAPKYFDYE